MDALSIRRVAKEAGCTSAVLYRHFENKEHLLMMASVKYLGPYIQELIKQSERTDITPIQMDLILWKKFIYEAFHGHYYYQVLFFSGCKGSLSEYIDEYYRLFPQEQKKFDGKIASIMVSSNITERERIRLEMAASEGYISKENANLLAKTASAVFAGMFFQIPNDAKEEELIQMAKECYQMIYELFKKFVKRGTQLDINE